ncbi:MAG: hypothetical protein R3283_11220 [Balneolaceae bacterium]|nr:hypothetical protein [Balneolaceae bacterium]
MVAYDTGSGELRTHYAGFLTAVSEERQKTAAPELYWRFGLTMCPF